MNDKTVKIKYKIHDMTTGLYQDIGYNKRLLMAAEPKWSKRGKTWTTLEDLKNHLKSLEEMRIVISPLWEIVEFNKTTTTGVRYSATALSSKKG